ncbi:MAG: primase-helicase family protein [Bacteroidota bacterium]
MINVINYYNTNYSDQALEIMLKKDKIIERKNKTIFTYNLNKAEDFAKWDGTTLKILGDFPDFNKGTILTPFDLLCKYRFKGNLMTTVAYLIKEFDPQKLPFARIGSDYFKVKHQTNGSGEVLSDKLIPFLKGEIRQDFGKDSFDYIPKYDEFCIEPNNINYERVVNGNYNNYHKVYHTPAKFNLKTEMNKIHWSMILMKHIFGDQLEMGLDYMKLLYETPKQILPILVLASEERQTGKTTFANWLEIIYKENFVSIGVSDMKGEFNAHISEKLIIAVEETVSESHGLVNKMKRISTAKKMLVNKKNISQYSVNFYGKILVLTNKPDKFLQIDNEEIRFWVRTIPTITESNHNIEADLEKELPYFLYYLNKRAEVDRSKSRMVFTPEQLGTDALKVVKKESRSALEKDICEYLDGFCLDNIDFPTLRFTAIDVKNKFFSRDSKINVSRISRTLKEMKLKQNGKNGRYRKFEDTPMLKSGNGNFFMFKNKHCGEPDTDLDVEDESINDDGLPF